MDVGGRRCNDDEPRKKCDPDAGSQAAANACFDCNICLDFAAEPVVTLCGHLYCWPCIYRWLQQADGGTAPQQCPVCKAALSRDALVPLYGRGGHHGAKKPHAGLEVPRRPTPVRRDAVEHRTPEEELPPQHRHPHPSPGWDYMSVPPRVIHSTAGGVRGGMAVAVLPWVFRNQGWASVYHSNPNYIVGDGGSPRLRRQELELERILHQIWVFLLSCAILCLLLF